MRQSTQPGIDRIGRHCTRAAFAGKLVLAGQDLRTFLRDARSQITIDEYALLHRTPAGVAGATDRLVTVPQTAINATLAPLLWPRQNKVQGE
jgi:hypothetical protein